MLNNIMTIVKQGPCQISETPSYGQTEWLTAFATEQDM